MTAPRSITIRRATPDDARAVERLAELEGVRPPAGDLLVGEVDGELWAAVELGSDAAVADPFRPSGEVAELVHLRVKRLTRPSRDKLAAGSCSVAKPFLA